MRGKHFGAAAEPNCRDGGNTREADTINNTNNHKARTFRNASLSLRLILTLVASFSSSCRCISSSSFFLRRDSRMSGKGMASEEADDGGGIASTGNKAGEVAVLVLVATLSWMPGNREGHCE